MLRALLALAVLAAPGPQVPAAPLVRVQKIYLESMGRDDEAARFRGLLQQELVAAGYTIVDERLKADAILTGFLSIRVRRGTSRAFATVTLRGPDGQILWGREVGPKPRAALDYDPVKLRAVDLVKRLKEDQLVAGRGAASAFLMRPIR